MTKRRASRLPPGIKAGSLEDGTEVWQVSGRAQVTCPTTSKRVRRKREGHVLREEPLSAAMALKEKLVEEARVACLEALGLIETQDGRLEAPPPQAKTLGAFAPLWIERNESDWGDKHAGHVLRVLEQRVLPHFGAMTANELHASHLAVWWVWAQQQRKPLTKVQKEAGISEGDPFRASVLRGWWGLLKKILGAFIIEEGRYDFGFVLDHASTPELRGRGKLRRQRLELGEAHRVLDHVGGDGTVRDLLRVVLDTGCRTKEIRTLRWDQVDLEQGELLLEKTKTDVVRTATLFDRSWALLKSRRAALQEQEVIPLLVFPSSETGRALHHTGITHSLAKASERAGLERALLPHTLRGIRATDLLARGLSTQMVQTVTGHQSTQALAIYTRPTAEQLRRLATSRG